MKRFIARRLMQGVVLLFMVATIVFFLGRLTGNPVDLMLPEDATAEDRAQLTQTLGLDGPLSDQFLIFIGKALHGDLGTSIRMKQPAAEAFFDRLPNTLLLLPWALLLGMGLGIPLGVVAALHRGGWLDRGFQMMDHSPSVTHAAGHRCQTRPPPIPHAPCCSSRSGYAA